MEQVFSELCRRADWNRPELAPWAALHRAGDERAAALGLVRHLRERAEPVFCESPALVEAVRRAAGPDRIRAAEQLRERWLALDETDNLRAMSHPPQDLVLFYLVSSPETCRALAEHALAMRKHWGQGAWGSTRGLGHLLQTLWPLPEFADEHAAVFLAWLLVQAEREWEWARTWSEPMLGHDGHNWYICTYSGFYELGLFFPEFTGTARFRALAPDYIERELRLLMQPDGFTRERSGYHYGTVHHFLDVMRAAEANGVVFSAAARRRLRAAAEVDWKLVTPDGGVPSNGDTGKRHTAGHLGGPLRLCAALFDCGEARFAAEALTPGWTAPFPGLLLHRGRNLQADYERVAARRPPGPPDTSLPESGYYVMRSDWTPSADYLFLDAGARGTIVSSHDHTAVFHLELYSRGRLILSDNYSGPYGEEPARRWRIGSAAHNVATVDGADHLPVRNEWRWEGVVAPTLDAWESAPGWCYFSGAHEGYARAPIRVPSARRKVFYRRGGYWILLDRHVPEDGRPHTYRTHFHLAAPARLDAGGRAVTTGPGGNLLIAPAAAGRLDAALEPNPFPLEDYDNPDHLCYARTTEGPDLFAAVLAPFEGDRPPRLTLRHLPVACDGRTPAPWEITALEIGLDGRTDVFVVQHMHWDLPWEAGGCAGLRRLFHSGCAMPP